MREFIAQIVNIAPLLSGGMLGSISIFALTLIFSLPLGLIICFGRMSRIAPIRWLTTFYISVMRGTPLMLQLFVVFFAPHYVFKVTLSRDYRYYAVIIGFAINYAAYFAEIYRGGIQSMPQGQYEAAQVLGYSRVQTFFRIIMPQVIKRILPSVTNEVITLVKDTSLAYVISYAEMFTEAKRIASSRGNIVPLMVAGVFYYVFNFVVAWVMDKIEKRL